MKDFIKAHPYLGCAGLALATNSAVGVYAAIYTKNPLAFFGGFGGSTLFFTMPSIVTVAIDKYVNKNITENVPIQYGLTAAESVFSMSIFASAIKTANNTTSNSDPGFSKVFISFYKNLFLLDFSEDSIFIKVLTIGVLPQSLGFKYILDLADEQIEIENDQSLFGEDNLQDGFEAEIFLQ